MSRWASEHIERLRAGRTVSFRPEGRSMEPLIRSGDLCTVAPVDARLDGVLAKGGIVLCEANGSHYLHKILDVRREGGAPIFLIGNNRGRTNGWVGPDHIFGKLTGVKGQHHRSH